MIDLDFVERLIRALDESGVDHVEIERGGTKIRISKTPSVTVSSSPVMAGSLGGAMAGGHAPAPALSPAPGTPAPPAPPPPPPPSNLVEITSPMVGTFYRSSAPGSPPFVEIGSRIAKGDGLCIIEAMKLMNEMEAEMEGTIRDVCVSNGEPVEYGQVLFRVEPG